MMRAKLQIVLVIAVLVVSNLACSYVTGSQPAAPAEKESQTVVESTAVSPEEKEAPTATEAPQPTEEAPTQAPEPTEVPEVDDAPLAMDEDVAFVQQETSLTVIFKMTNPNSQSAIRGSEYAITAYDEDDKEVGNTSGYIEVMLPGETQAVVDEIILEEGLKAARVEVKLESGAIEQMDLVPPVYSVDQLHFIADEYFPRVTGIITSKLPETMTYLRITAVTYKSNGKINGGGFTSIDFLPAEGHTAADVNVQVDGEVDKVEIYASLTSLEPDNPSEAAAITILDQGFSQNYDQVSAGFVIHNMLKDQTLGDTEYLIIAYDAEGNVIDTRNGLIYLLFPGETLGLTNLLYLPAETTADHLEVIINPGSPTDYFMEDSPFTVKDIKYLPDEYFPKVTAVIESAYTKEINNFQIDAVVFDEAGLIIGGGTTTFDVVPASGQVEVTISIDCLGTPSRVEVYPSISIISLIEE